MSPELIVEEWRSLFTTKIYKNQLIEIIINEAYCVLQVREV